MAAETAAGSPVTTSSNASTPRERKRYARLPPLYKALIWTSFLINAVLIIIVAVVVGLLVTSQRQLQGLAGNGTAFAANNLAELQDVVGKLESSTIVYTVPLSTSLPVQIPVAINPSTIQTPRNVVTLTEPVPLAVPASILFPGGGGNLNATVNIQLPAGLELPVNLDMVVYLDTQIPVQLDVPVRIPLAETELGPQFRRLGAIVDRLVTPIEPILPWPEQAPDSALPPAPDAALPREEPGLPEPQPAAP